MLLSIPMAWLQLVHYRLRFAATLAGIAFVVVLLFQQLGFQAALFESAVRVHSSLRGDLFLISTQYKSLTSQQHFPRVRLYQTLAMDTVDSVSPLYFQFGKLKNINTNQKFSIFVLGVDPGRSIFNLSDFNENLDLLKIPDLALYDRGSRPEFGPIVEKFTSGEETIIELTPFNEIVDARRLKVGGLFNVGPSFGYDGILAINYSTFLREFDRRADEIDVGAIQLKSGTRIRAAQRHLQAVLPNDVRVLTRGEFITLEQNYWDARTPIGFAFRVMVSMAFIVGIGISYQVLYSNISNHLIEFATLKAIGFTNHYLHKLVFQQAFLLSVLGYLPGIIISLILFDITRDATNLPIRMSLEKLSIVLISICSMCAVSGFLAMQKLRSTDPAEIF